MTAPRTIETSCPNPKCKASVNKRIDGPVGVTTLMRCHKCYTEYRVRMDQFGFKVKKRLKQSGRV